MHRIFIAFGIFALAGGALAWAEAKKDYEIAVKDSTLLLTPKATSPVAKAFQKIELRLDPKTLLMKSILLTEKNGDEKEITFTRLSKNASLPADAFK